MSALPVIERAYTLYMPQIKYEIEKLYILVSNFHPTNILEIGTKFGGTAYLWNYILTTVRAAEYTTFTSIDLPGGDFGGIAPDMVKYRNAVFELMFGGSRHSIQFIDMDSKLVTDEMLRDDYDFIFIDGCHTFEGVKSDFELALRHSHSGTIIAFHDIVDSPEHRNRGVEVCDFWNHIKHDTRFDHMEIVESREQSWAGIGVLFVI